MAIALRNSWGPVLLGATTGFLSALVPSGFAVYPDGAGVLGGMGAACLGAAALAPVVLVFLVASAVGRDDDDRVSVEYFFSDVSALWYRGGACGAGVAQWTVFVVCAIAAGAITGLGDGLRQAHPVGSAGKVLLPFLLLVLVTAYLGIIAAGVSVNANGRLRGFACNYGLLALFLALLALGPESPLAQIARFLPAAPLWSLLPREVTGRYTQPTPWVESVGVASAWVFLGVVAFLSRVRRGGLANQE
ncbi:hypothetical protein [Krasilnikovia sp. M28-CT-15]|uniref:hypothetical protein n=1 Tax=Krasilnikovia sp. M28-CT-15 TaxID=3373540 RepID=UPI00399CD9DD